MHNVAFEKQQKRKIYLNATSFVFHSKWDDETEEMLLKFTNDKKIWLQKGINPETDNSTVILLNNKIACLY